MKIGIQGTTKFSDYQVFLRAMGVAMWSPDKEKEIIFYSAGPHKVNGFLTGFVNITERNLKARDIKVKKFLVSQRWLEDHMDELDYVAYLSTRDGPLTSSLIRAAEDANVDVGVFRF